ncbi:hypothetical protein JCM10449v2_004399 [Rhodotorula kratochvilovae]
MSADEIERRAKLPSGPLLPLLAPKALSRALPPLPLRAASSSPLAPGWTCETVILPAAFPRSYPRSTKHAHEPRANPAVSSAGGRANPDDALAALVAPQVEALRQPVSIEDAAELERQEQLVTVANRYRPATRREGSGPGLTLVFSHANGFYKEVWEPMLATLLDRLEVNGRSLPVDEVWGVDCVNQGDAGVLNGEVLGDVFNWADHGRDLLNLIISYGDSTSSSSTGLLNPVPGVPAHLNLLDNAPALPSGPTIAAARTYRNRLIVGIGHSLGGGATAYAASALPALFSSVVFVDPVLPNPTIDTRAMGKLTTGALMRRETWKTREEARAAFLKKPFFQAWDPRVLEGYIEHGLVDVEGGVALKVTARNEALTFMDPMAVAARRAAARLPLLPSSLPTHFIFAEKGRSVLDEANIAYLLSESVPHATASRVQGAGHLLVHEKPDDAAQHLLDFLERTYPRQERARL